MVYWHKQIFNAELLRERTDCGMWSLHIGVAMCILSTIVMDHQHLLSALLSNAICLLERVASLHVGESWNQDSMPFWGQLEVERQRESAAYLLYVCCMHLYGCTLIPLFVCACNLHLWCVWHWQGSCHFWTTSLTHKFVQGVITLSDYWYVRLVSWSAFDVYSQRLSTQCIALHVDNSGISSFFYSGRMTFSHCTHT